MSRHGSWWLESKSDPRWNCSGYAHSLSAFYQPEEVKRAVESLTKQFGEPPADLEYGCMKD